MILKTVMLNLSILLLSISALYECKTIHTHFGEEFVNLAVVSDYVYIGGNHSLVQLNSSLGIVNIKPTKGSNWLLTPYETKNEGTILIACDYKGEDDSDCIGHRSNLSTVDRYHRKDILIKKPHARYTTTTIGSNNILTIASSDCLKAASGPNNVCFAISNYEDNIFKFNHYGKYTVKYLTVNGVNPKINLDFKTVVGNGTYTYFLFILNHTISKLGKICVDPATSTSQFNAYEDVPIFCSHNGVNFTTAHDLIFWNDDLLVVFTDGTSSVICRLTNLYDNFEISRIERLKCPFRKLKNSYFNNTSTDTCYNISGAMPKCDSRSKEGVVSIILGLL